ncbi:MAG: hypothetical protein ACK4VW_02760 [Anaerolineales bacterium]
MPPIRASEIGEYLYCRRAWWYRQKGYTSENQQELESGQAFHRKHARLVWQMIFTRTAALFLLLLALMLLVAYCTVHL